MSQAKPITRPPSFLPPRELPKTPQPPTAPNPPAHLDPPKPQALTAATEASTAPAKAKLRKFTDNLPEALSWTCDTIDALEAVFVAASPDQWNVWALGALQRNFGIVSPGRLLPDPYALANKTRAAILTDSNTKIRPNIRRTLSFLVAHNEVFALDPRLLAQSAVNFVIGDALAALANAFLNLSAKNEINT